MQGPAQHIQPLGIKTPADAVATIEGSLQQLLNPCLTKLTQAKPELENFSRPSALKTRLAAVVIANGRVHVGQSRGEGGSQQGRIAQQQQGRCLGDAQQLLRIQRDGVGQGDSIHQGGCGPCKGKDATDGGIDMQPDVVTPADRRHGSERIHSPTHRGSCRGHNSDAGSALLLQIPQGLLQRLGRHATVVVNGQSLQSIAAKPHHPRGFQQGHVGISAADHHTLLTLLLRQAITGHQQAHEVAERASGRQDTAA